MGNHRDLDVLDAADQVADDVNRLIDESPRRLIHTTQLRKAAQSIGSNISEGFGRGTDSERNCSLRVARGEAEETIRHLRANFAANRIERAVFWRLRNRLVTIIKMLTALMKRVA
jgi:four helix bundle protein